MNALVGQALALWGMGGASTRLVAARENHVYRVDHEDRSYALRLRRPGYRSDAELRSELDWMAAVASGGLHVPTPVPSLSGAYLQEIDGVRADMLDWLSGRPMAVLFDTETPGFGAELFRRLGRAMADLHRISQDWDQPAGFVRCRWDREGLLGEAPIWGRFWQNPMLGEEDRRLFSAVREEAGRHLRDVEGDLDFGLIHADLVRENVLVDGSRLWLIDFDDGGFGFRLFDVATSLLKTIEAPDHVALRAALFGGYRERRALDTGDLDLFLLLRALTYVGWIIDRMDEPGAAERNARFVTRARALAKRYLS